MSGFTAAGILHTTVTNESSAGADDASQLAPLGFVLTVPDGDNGVQEWVYIKNGGTTALRGAYSGAGADYDAVELTSAYTMFLAERGYTASAVAGKIMGVAQHEIGRNGYGFVLRKGKGKVTTNGTVAQGECFKIAAAGQVADFGTDAASIIGMALAGDSGGSAVVDAYINCNAG